MTETPWMAERRLPSPAEKQAIIRRAHAERAKAIRDAVAALFAWRKHDASPASVAASVNAAPCA